MQSVQESSHSFVDRRKHPRKTVRIGATAILANSDAAIECTVVDISESGAKLELTNIDIVPSKLKLFVPDNDFIYECEVVWRDGSYLGVKFVNGVSL